MPTTLMFLCAGATRMSRIGGFAGPDEPLDDGGRQASSRLEIADRFHARVLASPMQCAIETGDALGLSPQVAPALADIDFGEWSGRSFEQIHGDDPEGLGAWIADPVIAAPGGETLENVRQRISGWMDAIPGEAGPLCAISHPMVIRAALVHALELSFRSALAIDLAPLSRVLLSHHGQWRLQAIGPID